MNGSFAWSFENIIDRIVRIVYYFSKVEIKYSRFMVDRGTFFDQPVKYDIRPYEYIIKITNDWGED